MDQPVELLYLPHCENATLPTVHLIHYLDDFFLDGPPDSPRCGEQLDCLLRFAAHLGVVIAMGKVEGPATELTFLGLTLDSIRQEICLPSRKLQDLLGELQQWALHHKCTKRELLSLIGKLSFVARAVPAGRLFLRRLITLSTTVPQLHHHIRLMTMPRPTSSGVEPSYHCGMVQLPSVATIAPDFSLYTDAAGTLGCGTFFQGEWFHYSWEPHQAMQSIQWKELSIGCSSDLGPSLVGETPQISFDNKTIVLAWQSQRAKHPDLMTLLRRLFLTAANGNFHNNNTSQAHPTHLLHIMTQTIYPFFLSKPSGKHFTHCDPRHPHHPLTTHFWHLVSRALAHSTS